MSEQLATYTSDVEDDVFFIVDDDWLLVALSTNTSDLSVNGGSERRSMVDARDARVREAATALAVEWGSTGTFGTLALVLIQNHSFVHAVAFHPEVGLNWTLVRTYPVRCPAGMRESRELGCVDCDETWWSFPESASCDFCATGYFLNGDGRCEACPSRFYCDAPGSDLEGLLLHRGYMRMSSRSTEALKCANARACPLEVGRVTCDPRRGAEGPRCSVCDDGYFTNDRARCVSCDRAFAANSPETVVGIVISLLVLCGFLYLIVTMTKPHAGGIKRAGKLSRLNQKLTVKWKIVFVAFQILYTMPSMLPGTRFPKAYSMVFMAFDIVTLDVANALPLECVDVFGGGSGFYRALLVMTLGPASFIAFAIAVSFVLHYLEGYIMSARDLRKAGISVTILVTYLLLPAVTTTIVRAFPCEDFDDPRGTDDRVSYLHVDLNIRCDSKTHRIYIIYSALMLFCWPVGVPGLTFLILYVYRDRLNPVVEETGERRKARKSLNHRLQYLDRRQRAVEIREKDEGIQHLQLLYGPYEPEYFYWEIFEMLRRLMLTSGLLLISRGPLSKVFFAIVVALATQKAYSYFQPYASDSDDVLAETLQWVTLLTFLATLACAVGQANPAIAAAMILLQVAGLVVVAWLMIRDVKREKDALALLQDELTKLAEEQLLAAPRRFNLQRTESGKHLTILNNARRRVSSLMAAPLRALSRQRATSRERRDANAAAPKAPAAVDDAAASETRLAVAAADSSSETTRLGDYDGEQDTLCGAAPLSLPPAEEGKDASRSPS